MLCLYICVSEGDILVDLVWSRDLLILTTRSYFSCCFLFRAHEHTHTHTPGVFSAAWPSHGGVIFQSSLGELPVAHGLRSPWIMLSGLGESPPAAAFKLDVKSQTALNVVVSSRKSDLSRKSDNLFWSHLIHFRRHPGPPSCWSTSFFSRLS